MSAKLVSGKLAKTASYYENCAAQQRNVSRPQPSLSGPVPTSPPAIGAAPAVRFLAAGANATVTVDWSIPAGITNQSISVTVDPDLAREDRNRANNSASLIVLAPDLAITEMSVMNSARDRRMINARVVNQGNYACASGFQVSFRRGGADGPVIGTLAVEAIPSGGQYDANLEWNMAGVTFTNAYETVYVVADAGGAVADSDRDNNASFVQLATTFDTDGNRACRRRRPTASWNTWSRRRRRTRQPSTG